MNISVASILINKIFSKKKQNRNLGVFDFHIKTHLLVTIFCSIELT